MRTRLLLFSIFYLSTAVLLAAAGPLRSHGDYFFPPPRSLYYFQPGLYIFDQCPPVYLRHSYPRYRSPRAYVRAGAPVVPYPVSHKGVYRTYLTAPGGSPMVRANSSDLIFTVTPSRALVYLDDKLIGSARSFATERERYPLQQGEYNLRIEFPGYEPFETRLVVVPDRTLHLDIELDPDSSR